MIDKRGAHSDRTYADRWTDDGPTVKLILDWDAADPERARSALSRVYLQMVEDIDNAARAYHAKESQ